VKIPDNYYLYSILIDVVMSKWAGIQRVQVTSIEWYGGSIILEYLPAWTVNLDVMDNRIVSSKVVAFML
jgi:hypothetical protein